MWANYDIQAYEGHYTDTFVSGDGQLKTVTDLHFNEEVKVELKHGKVSSTSRTLTATGQRAMRRGRLTRRGQMRERNADPVASFFRNQSGQSSARRSAPTSRCARTRGS